MLAATTGRCTTKVLLGVVWTAPAGALVQLATAVALMAVLALLLIVTLSCPVSVAPTARSGTAKATASMVAPAGTAVTYVLAGAPSTWYSVCAPTVLVCAAANVVLAGIGTLSSSTVTAAPLTVAATPLASPPPLLSAFVVKVTVAPGVLEFVAEVSVTLSAAVVPVLTLAPTVLEFSAWPELWSELTAAVLVTTVPAGGGAAWTTAARGRISPTSRTWRSSRNM